MKTYLTKYTFPFSYPAQSVPTWSPKVDRWYQLDAYSYGICEAIDYWRGKEKMFLKPSFILLASRAASNEADWQFVQTGAESPSKFAHTLPNVRSLPLAQVMDLMGPVLCIQKDPQTFARGLVEATVHISNKVPTVWVIGVRKMGSFKGTIAEGSYVVDLLVLTQEEGSFPYQVIVDQYETDKNLALDGDFLSWIEKEKVEEKGEAFELLPGITIRSRK